jgi:hypothetical protein
MQQSTIQAQNKQARHGPSETSEMNERDTQVLQKLVNPKQQFSPPYQKRIAWLVAAINQPWLLITMPILLGGTWLILHPEVITDNIEKPYALLAGPALIGSILLGWLIISCFKTIALWCRLSWQSFGQWRRKDGSAFWLVIAIFLFVSVLESGSYFNELLGTASLSGILGYAVALVIDLVAVECMRARLGAVRMRDYTGQRLYLFGVIACAGLSAFANTYTALKHYHAPIGTLLPDWMMLIAPWSGMAFPLLIIFLSFTADYTADQTSTKLDPENYKTQENKRLQLLAIQRDMLRERVQIEQEIDLLNQRAQQGKGRYYFSFARLFSLKSPSALEQFNALYEAQLASIVQQQQSLQESSTQTQQHHEQMLRALSQDLEEDRHVFARSLEDMQVHLSEQREQEYQQMLPRFQQEMTIAITSLQNHVGDQVKTLVDTRLSRTFAARERDRQALSATFLAVPYDGEKVSAGVAEGSSRTNGEQGEGPILLQSQPKKSRSWVARTLNDPASQVIFANYPLVKQWLTTGIKNLTVEEIVENTGHSRRMVQNRVKDETIKKAKSPNKYRIESVFEWLKFAPLPKHPAIMHKSSYDEGKEMDNITDMNLESVTYNTSYSPLTTGPRTEEIPQVSSFFLMAEGASLQGSDREFQQV